MGGIGLVLGGGGITGASFQIATLLALELACDWEARQADVIVGTSGGAFVAALVRAGRLDVDSLVRPDDDRETVAERIRRQVFVIDPAFAVGRWLREGLLPSLRRPGVTAVLGSPARYSPSGIAAWVRDQAGEMAEGWPDLPTLIASYDLTDRRRVAFGSPTAPQVGIAEAVAASSAIPLLFHPHSIAGRPYVDGGVVSGTHLDLVLGASRPLALIIVIAPMAAETARSRAWPLERLLDGVGRRALQQEVAHVAARWPQADVLVLCPPPGVLEEMRPNPMAAAAAVPTFIRTLSAMRRKLAEPAVWKLLHRHLATPRTGAMP